MADREFGDAPFVEGSETSEAAAEAIAGKARSMEAEVFGFVSQRGEYGATVDEIEVALDMLHQTAGARVRGLVLHGHLRATDLRRRTRSERWATVWAIAPPPGQAELWSK